MKQFLYPLVATALITITPFLFTFEKGQDIVRGLLDYSVFALLLVYVYVRGNIKKTLLKRAFMGLIIFLIISVAWIDLQNILSLQHRTTGFWGVFPFITTLMALVLLKSVKTFSISQISISLFILFALHVFFLPLFPSQPLVEFPVIKALNNSVKMVKRDFLPASFKEQYEIIDTATITSRYIDSSRSNVVVLVESWGVPIDDSQRHTLYQIFDPISTVKGIHSRAYSRTRTAEREDLLAHIIKNQKGKDSVFLPQILSEQQVKTMFFFGGDSMQQNRFCYIKNIGFESSSFSTINKNDSLMLLKMDSTLQENVNTKVFIAWTTLDTHFPIPGDVFTLKKIYDQKLFNTLQGIADLAKKYPDIRFIVQGDHEPILSPKSFQELFYKRWVPFVILN